MQINLAGKTAIITGASRGIGAAIFRAFGNAGAAVLGTATGDAGIAAVQKSAADNGFSGAAQKYDAANPEEAAALVAAAKEMFGGAPDIVVCNAGITADGLLMRMKDEEWGRVLRTNLDGVFYLARAAIPGMLKKRGGRIIAVSSVVASTGNAGQINYCASKAGAEGFMRALSREAGGRGITANAIAPGFIETDMTAALPAALRETLLAQIPLGRIGAPEEVAAAAVFLASDAASYISGHTLHVNGGMRAG